MLEEKKIRERLQKVFAEPLEDSADHLVFHLTDWIQDLEDIYRIYSNIENISDDEIAIKIYAFLAHVPNHLVAAKKISGIGPTEDIFKVGIFEEDD
jgi:hypothetical protein